jgi:hypothetical protein
MTVLHQLSESTFLTGTSGAVVRQALGEPYSWAETAGWR